MDEAENQTKAPDPILDAYGSPIKALNPRLEAVSNIWPMIEASFRACGINVVLIACPTAEGVLPDKDNFIWRSFIAEDGINIGRWLREVGEKMVQEEARRKLTRQAAATVTTLG